LIRQSGSPRPAFVTYRVAVQYLSDFEEVVRERWDGVGQIRVTQPGRTTTVLFSRLPVEQEARVEATAETAVLATMWGQREEVTAEDGFFTVELPPALCTQSIGDYCMIGGSAFYLVQSDSGGDPPLAPLPPGHPTSIPNPDLPTNTPTTTNTPIPTRTATATPTPTWTATATATATPTRTSTPTPSITPSPTPSSTITPTPTFSFSPTPPPLIETAASGPKPFNLWPIAVAGTLLLFAGAISARIRRQRKTG
jgi:hypothetical protein